MMKDLITTVIGIMTASFSLFGQTDAYIKLHDTHGMHPRIVSITFPGDANTLDMYNSIYGHGAVLENPFREISTSRSRESALTLYLWIMSMGCPLNIQALSLISAVLSETTVCVLVLTESIVTGLLPCHPLKDPAAMLFPAQSTSHP